MRGVGNHQDFQKLIGGKLRTLRQEAGLSQRSLAQKLDLSHQQIQKYERGDNALPLQRVKSFAHALGVSPADLAFPRDEQQGTEAGAKLSPDRTELLRLYDGLPDRETKNHLMGMVRSLEALLKRLI